MQAVGAMRVEVGRKAFGETAVLTRVNISVEQGEIAVLTGQSGIGKTTLLRIIAGLDLDFEGSVDHQGRIGMVFQSPTLLPWRSASDNLTLTTGVDTAYAKRLLAEVGLEGKANSYPGQLSLGQQRRLALARALAAEPTTMLMDEPFISLDEETAGRMRRLTLDILRDRRVATLIVTHDLTEAAIFADRILMLGGRPATIQTVAAIATPRDKRNIAEETDKLRELMPGANVAHHGKLT